MYVYFFYSQNSESQESKGGGENRNSNDSPWPEFEMSLRWRRKAKKSFRVQSTEIVRNFSGRWPKLYSKLFICKLLAPPLKCEYKERAEAPSNQLAELLRRTEEFEALLCLNELKKSKTVWLCGKWTHFLWPWSPWPYKLSNCDVSAVQRRYTNVCISREVFFFAGRNRNLSEGQAERLQVTFLQSQRGN